MSWKSCALLVEWKAFRGLFYRTVTIPFLKRYCVIILADRKSPMTPNQREEGKRDERH